MSKQSLMEKIDKLPPERIDQVEKFVDEIERRSAQDELADQLEQRLYAAGVLSEIKPLIDPNSYQDFEPIENKGKPLSEVIIEERR